MKTTGQWMMISGGISTVLIGLMVFLLVLFPSCAPEYCATYSPIPGQVVSVYLKTTVRENNIRRIARDRISEHFRSRAVPALEAGLRSPQAGEDEFWSAIGALGDLRAEARPAVPAILVAMASGRLSRDRHIGNVLARTLADIGVTSDWRTGISARDPWISQVFWDGARMSASVDGFLLCWDALRSDEIINRTEALASVKTFHFSNMKAEMRSRIEPHLDAAIAHGPDDMRESAAWLKAWSKRETEPSDGGPGH